MSALRPLECFQYGIGSHSFLSQSQNATVWELARDSGVHVNGWSRAESSRVEPVFAERILWLISEPLRLSFSLLGCVFLALMRVQLIWIWEKWSPSPFKSERKTRYYHKTPTKSQASAWRHNVWGTDEPTRKKSLQNPGICWYQSSEFQALLILFSKLWQSF